MRHLLGVTGMRKQFVFGIGTGRCGTSSLRALLNLQRSSQFYHELRPLTKWENDLASVREKTAALANLSATFVGDAAFYYLPYVPYLINELNARIVCLKRDKESTVSSYLKWTKGRNHWIRHRGWRWRLDPEWDSCFPKYGVLRKRTAVSQYYDDYYGRVDDLLKTYPSHLMLLSTDGLNDALQVSRVLTFCGFVAPTIATHIKRNTILHPDYLHSPSNAKRAA